MEESHHTELKCMELMCIPHVSERGGGGLNPTLSAFILLILKFKIFNNFLHKYI